MIEAIKWKPYEGETVIVKTILRKGKKIQKKKFYKDKVKAVPKGNAYIIGNGPSRKDFDLGKLKTKCKDRKVYKCSPSKKLRK